MHKIYSYMFRHSMGAILRECLQSHTGTRINILVLVQVCDCAAYGPIESTTKTTVKTPCRWHQHDVYKLSFKMQLYTIFFINVNVLHVSGGFYAHHQELKTVHTVSGICQACLLLPLSWLSWNSTTIAVAASKPGTYQMLCTVLELLMMGGGTARNMYSIDNNKEYCITMNLFGCT
jgi:predicted glycosyltransferase involved in capsule biosynthesis